MRALARILIMIAVPALVAFGVARAMVAIFLAPYDAQNSRPVLFEVASGQSFRSIAKSLESQNLLRYWWSLEVLGRVRQGKTIINTGEYQLSQNMNPLEILGKLLDGETFKRRVTIREGMSIWNIGNLFQVAGLASKEQFEKELANPLVIHHAGVQATSLEGYLFPETYFFSKPISIEEMIQTMVNQGNKVWTPERNQRAIELGLTRHETLTIASIVEKETGVISEQRVISSVIHNRLKAGMKLQLDPTVIYGIPNFNGNLTKADLERPTPYNTYTNYGLPPGPIANPGESAIDAALFPDKTEFLYFVADRSGGHVFSATLAEHNGAVQRFQLNK